MHVEVIVDKKQDNGKFVKVTRIFEGFPIPSYYVVETETGKKLEEGDAENALRILAKYI